MSTQAFYASCNPAHREFYSSLIHDWQEAGQPVAYAGEGARVELQLRSVAGAEGEGLPCLFVLHAGGPTDRPRIALDRDQWRQWFGAELRDMLIEEVCAIPGLMHRRQGSEFAILEPAHLSGPTQQRLRDLLVQFSRRAQEVLGR